MPLGYELVKAPALSTRAVSGVGSKWVAGAGALTTKQRELGLIAVE